MRFQLRLSTFLLLLLLASCTPCSEYRSRRSRELSGYRVSESGWASRSRTPTEFLYYNAVPGPNIKIIVFNDYGFSQAFISSDAARLPNPGEASFDIVTNNSRLITGSASRFVEIPAPEAESCFVIAVVSFVFPSAWHLSITESDPRPGAPFGRATCSEIAVGSISPGVEFSMSFGFSVSQFFVQKAPGEELDLITSGNTDYRIYLADASREPDVDIFAFSQVFTVAKSTNFSAQVQTFATEYPSCIEAYIVPVSDTLYPEARFRFESGLVSRTTIAEPDPSPIPCSQFLGSDLDTELSGSTMIQVEGNSSDYQRFFFNAVPGQSINVSISTEYGFSQVFISTNPSRIRSPSESAFDLYTNQRSVVGGLDTRFIQVPAPEAETCFVIAVETLSSPTRSSLAINARQEAPMPFASARCSELAVDPIYTPGQEYVVRGSGWSYLFIQKNPGEELSFSTFGNYDYTIYIADALNPLGPDDYSNASQVFYVSEFMNFTGEVQTSSIDNISCIAVGVYRPQNFDETAETFEARLMFQGPIQPPPSPPPCSRFRDPDSENVENELFGNQVILGGRNFTSGGTVFYYNAVPGSNINISVIMEYGFAQAQLFVWTNASEANSNSYISANKRVLSSGLFGRFVEVPAPETETCFLIEIVTSYYPGLYYLAINDPSLQEAPVAFANANCSELGLSPIYTPGQEFQVTASVYAFTYFYIQKAPGEQLNFSTNGTEGYDIYIADASNPSALELARNYFGIRTDPTNVSEIFHVFTIPGEYPYRTGVFSAEVQGSATENYACIAVAVSGTYDEVYSVADFVFDSRIASRSITSDPRSPVSSSAGPTTIDPRSESEPRSSPPSIATPASSEPVSTRSSSSQPVATTVGSSPEPTSSSQSPATISNPISTQPTTISSAPIPVPEETNAPAEPVPTSGDALPAEDSSEGRRDRMNSLILKIALPIAAVGLGAFVYLRSQRRKFKGAVTAPLLQESTELANRDPEAGIN